MKQDEHYSATFALGDRNIRMVDCLLVDCPGETLVTLNEETGDYEIRGFAIIPREKWEGLMRLVRELNGDGR